MSVTSDPQNVVHFPLQPNPFRNQVYCRYKRTHWYNMLRPLKEEILYLSPFVALYHDLITESEIETVKKLAKPKVDVLSYLLEWCHMSALASQITANSSACSTDSKVLHHRPFVRGKKVICDFLQNGPAMRKTFPYHYVIMHWSKLLSNLVRRRMGLGWGWDTRLLSLIHLQVTEIWKSACRLQMGWCLAWGGDTLGSLLWSIGILTMYQLDPSNHFYFKQVSPQIAATDTWDPFINMD